MNVRQEATTHSRLPHVVPFDRNPIVFITTVSHERRSILGDRTVHKVLHDVWAESLPRYGWTVGRYVIMPDHVHLFARPASDSVSLSRWMQAWKSFSARRCAETLGIRPPFWQRDYFDHFLRSNEGYSEKWAYVVENPVRAGLVACAEDWPWQGEVRPLQF